MRRLLRFTCASFIAIVVALLAALAGPQHASAHNSLEASDPTDGAVLDVAPPQITLDFAAAVPLETTTVQVVDPAGNRTEAALSHGAGDDQVVAALPALAAGETTIRWRLVGPDGHPLTGRIALTVNAAATTTVAAAPTPSVAAAAPAAAAAAPTTTPVAPASSTPVVVDQTVAGDDGGLVVPGALRWLLRYGSYLAVMIVVGVVLTDRFVWPGALERVVLRRAIRWAVVVIAVLALAQLLVIASDISGRAPWASLGSLDAALTTGAGMAMVVRLILAGAMWWVLFGTEATDVRDTALALGAVGLLGTWAWAGHSATQRWAEVGFPLDVTHHAAAALWIGALVIIGVVATRRLAADDLPPVVARLSRVAAICVGLIVATGLVQSVRLVGNPGDLFAAAHGRYLTVKLLAVGIMLAVAFINRRRVQAGLLTPSSANVDGPGRLRRTILIEFAIGIVIIGITSAMVVSPPTTATETGAAREDITTPYYYSL